uniref:Uncharacterized protein n=1 Tax=Plectus sambesii TaxID=2011161 RepID=A0A914WJQ2_9BILA
MIARTVATICLLWLTSVVQGDGNVPTVANDFVFAIFNAQVSDIGVLMYAIVSNNNNGSTRVTVTSPYSDFSTIHVTIAPFSILKIPITPMAIEAQYPAGNGNGQVVVENKGIRLVSDLPVAVYTHAELYNGGRYSHTPLI